MDCVIQRVQSTSYLHPPIRTQRLYSISCRSCTYPLYTHQLVNHSLIELPQAQLLGPKSTFLKRLPSPRFLSFADSFCIAYAHT